MANTIKEIGSTAQKYYNPKAMYFIPFVDGAKGTTFYKIQNVPRDTTSITQDDNEANIVNDEFSADPIINNVTQGAYKFTTEVADYQADVLKEFAGFTVDETSGKIYAPAGYKPIFAEVDLVFESGDTSNPLMAAVLPKVQFDSKALIEALNTNVGRLTINGTAYKLKVTDGVNEYESPFYLDPKFTEPTAG